VHAPVLLLLAPRSQASPGCLKPSPQVASLQTLVQASSLDWLPSSQASPGPLSPSPQTLSLHDARQALPAPLLAPSSHCSTFCWIRLSPQTAFLQSGCTRRCCCWRRPGRTARPCSSAAGRRRRPGSCRRRCRRRRCCRSCRRRTARPGRRSMLPHCSSLQVAEQPSPGMLLPSSHCSSGPLSPSPQTLSLHVALQALPGPFSAPLSHSSAPSPVLYSAPSPHTLVLALRGAGGVVGVVGPASHSSPLPGCTKPSLHTALVQAEVQASVSSALPSSHCSVGATLPSPQVASAHSLVHSSASSWLPSSQPSPGPTRPSPHTALVQSALQLFMSPLSAPSSHSSPGPGRRRRRRWPDTSRCTPVPGPLFRRRRRRPRRGRSCRRRRTARRRWCRTVVSGACWCSGRALARGRA
jgi:hypothetical protein